jgi:hypothetical protein
LAADLLQRAVKRWGDGIPLELLAGVSLACLKIAGGRLEEADDALDQVSRQIAEP